MRQMVLVSIMLCMILGVGLAGGRERLRSAKPAQLIIDDGIERQSSAPGQYVPGSDDPAALNWVAADSMANAFGPASDQVKPMAYDPGTNRLAVIHRGAAPYGASGQLWYNISRDNGATWYRVPSSLNGGTPENCRYPSCAISNPAGNADTSQALFVWAAPNLVNAGAFGQITYGVDFPLGGGGGIGVVDAATNDLTAAVTIWGQPNSSWVMWGSSRLATGVPNDNLMWRTNDYLTVTRTTPPGWRDTIPNFVNNLNFVGGTANSTGSYFTVNGLCYPDSLADAFGLAYSKSTDNGQTWGSWVRPSPDWMRATALPDAAYDLYDFVQPPGGTVSYSAEQAIDGNGRAHFFMVIVDTPATNVEPRHIVEVFQTTTGWDYKWVKQNLNRRTGLGYPDPTPGSTTPYLDQMQNALQASVSPDGQVVTLVWLDGPTTAPADTFPDIWFSYRRINSASWSTPVNLSQTPTFPELMLHAAPRLKSNGGNSYTLFLGRSYQSGINTYPPSNAAKTTFFVASHTFTADPNSVDQRNTPFRFALDQNFPNPFNPSTTIKYSLGESGLVNLKVFNTLGEEVAEVVNDVRSAGDHEVVYDASNLSSGVYYYSMRVGDFTQSKKMIVIK